MSDPCLTPEALQQRIAALSPERRSLFEQRLKQQGLSPALAGLPLIPQSRPPVVPLSPAQKNLWVLHQLDPDSSAYHIALSWRLTGSLNIPALEDSLKAIAQRHESLRTRFIEQAGQPYQIILPDFSLPLPVTDLRHLPADGVAAEVQRLTAQWVQQPFDLSRDPLLRGHLLRLDDTTAILLLILHHIVADGWSRGVLMREFAILYRGFVEGQVTALPPLPVQYADYTLWQQQWLQSDACRVQLDYWQRQLAALPVLNLPTDRPRPAVPNFTSRTCTAFLSPDWVAALKSLGHQEGTTLFMTLLAVFKLLLHRYSAQDDIGVGVPVANRNHPAVEPLIGFFVNTLVLRTRLTGGMTFRQLLQQVKQVSADAFHHAEVPFARVVETLQPDRDLSQNPLFQVMFQLQSGYQRQNAAHPDLALPGLNLQQTWVDPGQTKFDLTWHGIEQDDGLLLAVEYRIDLFDESRIQRMLGHFQTLLKGILASPDSRLAHLPILNPAERQQLLGEWNQTRSPLPTRCFHQCFEDQVEKTPNAIAIIDQTSQNPAQITYRQLNHRANQLAHTLQGKGIGPETLVGLYLPRSIELIVALLGVLKAGGAYVPIDPSLPAERVRFMLDDSQVVLVVTAGAEMVERVGSTYPTLDLVLEDEAIAQAPDHNPAPILDPENLAYVIYTSGSTGKPKGTLLTHQGLINYLNWCTEAYGVALGGAPVQSSVGFDATITSLFAPLLVGQPITLLPETQEIEALSQAIQGGDRFSLVKLTPSHLKALEPLVLPPSTHPLIHSSSQAFILGGEALQGRDITPWQRHFPSIRLINEYGPTEAVVGCCVYDVPADFAGDTVPIGRPIANVQLYVLDPDLEPVPIGIPGELYIGGAGVARGYLNRPDLTAERFVPNPFLGKAEGRRQKAEEVPFILHPSSFCLYKTGDRVRYRPDGILEYLGRMDDQIKLRGYRVEPGEIEAALCQHPQVKQVVVVLRDDLGEAAKLVAYVVKAEGRRQKAEDESFKFSVLSSQFDSTQNSKLKNYLAKKLPTYMLPDYFVTLEALPLTVNGKVDRKALPLPEIEIAVSEEDRPLTQTEQSLMGVLAEVLRLDAVGIHDNFFELGGDSILAMQVVAKAHQVGLHLTPRQLFQHQTVAELAAVAEVRLKSTLSQAAVTGMVPLTPIQQDFFAQELPEPHHFNQAVMVTVSQDVQPSILAQALQALVTHHDGLRSRFFSQEGVWQQVVQAPADGTVPLDTFTLSNLPQGSQTTALKSAIDELQMSLSLTEGPLFRAALFHLGEQGVRLLLIAHHLIVDGVSWRILLEDLTTAYQQLRAGGSAVLPPKTSSFQSWANRLIHLGRSRYFEAERSYWRDVCAPPTATLPVDFGRDTASNTVASAEEISVLLEADQTQALLTVAPQTYHAQVSDLLLAALGQTLKSWTQTSTVLVDLEGHGRDLALQNLQDSTSPDLSRTVGWFTAVYPLRLEIPSGAIADLLKSVKEQVRSVPHHGIGYGILRHLSPDPDPNLDSVADVSFNYLGQIRVDPMHENQGLVQALAPESVGALRSPLGSRRYLLDVIAVIRGDQLQVIWRYSRQVHRRATIEAIAQRYLATLRAYLTQPSAAAAFTPSDFAAARVNQAQLDQLLSKIRGN
ncbi:MAG: amino acid adenylation domain-containing protein [Synechococcales bacterium]|nr:amino acid adenylation domain-containing protein [Synechococcales bacterium]